VERNEIKIGFKETIICRRWTRRRIL